MPHTPHPRFQGKTQMGSRGDAMVQLDWTVGQILKALETHKLTDNTIVIFSSDNGPAYFEGYLNNKPAMDAGREGYKGHDASGLYRGGKYEIYEGGTRVPFIIRWPAKIQAGKTSDAMVSQVDLLASFAHLLGITLPDGQAADSRNMLDAFLGHDPAGLDEMVEEALGRLALRQGNWKLIDKGKSVQLYNLANDPSEQNDVTERHPDRVKQMRKRLQAIKEAH